MRSSVGRKRAIGLIVLALIKLLVTTLCLATGWKGGYIFPTLFAGAALGTAAHLLFPGIPEAVAIAGPARDLARHCGSYRRRRTSHYTSTDKIRPACLAAQAFVARRLMVPSQSQ